MARFEEGNEYGKETRFNGETAAENGRKGAIASNKAQREKKSLKSALLALLEAEHKSKSGEVKTGFEVISIGLYNKAMKGDSKAIKLISELIGEYKLRTDVTSNGEGLGLTINVANEDTRKKLEDLANGLGKDERGIQQES